MSLPGTTSLHSGLRSHSSGSGPVSMPEIAWVGGACDVIAWNAVRVIRASLDKQPRDVAAMFDQVADRYDLTNDVLSLGQDQCWRRACSRRSTPVPEILRMTKPGGRLLVCGFSRPTHPAFHEVYTEYLMKTLWSVARAVSSNPDSYVYLAESIQACPDQQGLATEVGRSGWRSVEWPNLTGGIVALHRAIRPA